MQNLTEHPTVKHFYERSGGLKSVPKVPVLNAEAIRQMCIEFGADDAGFVEIDRPELDDQRDDILKMFPWTKTLVSLIGRLNRESMRKTAQC